MQDRLILLVLLLLLLIQQSSSLNNFKPYKKIDKAHSGNQIRGVKICSQQTFMITWTDHYVNQLKIWNYTTLDNIKTYTYAYPSAIVFVQLHPIDCRIFVSLYNETLNNSSQTQYSTTIIILNAINFNQVETISFSNQYKNDIVFISEKKVFYLGGYLSLEIDQYNEDNYQFIETVSIPNGYAGVYYLDGYYNSQFGTILAVADGSDKIIIYNVETLTAFYPNIHSYTGAFQFSKSGKYLFSYYDYQCFSAYDSNQNITSFQQFSQICNTNISSPIYTILADYSDEFVIIGGYPFLQMIHINQNNSMSLIETLQLFDSSYQDYVQTLSEVNGILAVGTVYGNVILFELNYPHQTQPSPQPLPLPSPPLSSPNMNLGLIIGGVILFFLIILIVGIICYRCKKSPIKSTSPLSNNIQSQNPINDNIKKPITIESNQMKIKKSKQKRQDSSHDNDINSDKEGSTSNLNPKQVQNQNKQNDSRANFYQKQQSEERIRDIRDQHQQKIENEEYIQQNTSDEQNKKQPQKHIYMRKSKMNSRIKLQPMRKIVIQNKQQTIRLQQQYQEQKQKSRKLQQTKKEFNGEL